MLHEVEGKVFLITGAAAGIGEEVTRRFLAEGAEHIAILDITESTGKALEKELNAKYGENKTRFFKCDVTKDEELFYAFDETIKDFGYIDVVVNNAGIMNDNENSYKKEVEINVTALATSTFKAFKMMRKDEDGRGGAIINISSIAALTQDVSLPLYFGTKIAVLQFSNCLGLDMNYKRTGVRVITVCFGPTSTALFSAEKMSTYDKEFHHLLHNEEFMRNTLYFQRVESAANGVIEAYKRSPANGTWLAANDLPPEDITEDVKQAFDILGRKYRTVAKERVQAQVAEAK